MTVRRRNALQGIAAAAAFPVLSGRAEAQPVPAPISNLAPRHAISALGSPKLPFGFPHFPYVNPDAPKGGEMVTAALGSFDSFNPFIIRGTAAAGITNIYDSLLRSSADEAVTGYGHLARSIDLAPDRMWVVFNLRDDARFHDGTPITAEDVAWTFRTLQEKGRPIYRSFYADVAEVVVQNPASVVFRFKSNQNRELPVVLGELPILPKHWWEGRDFSRPLTDPPLGSGRYKIGRYEMGRSITYQRVGDYWGAKLPTVIGLGNFDTLRTEYFRDATVAMEAFKAGQVDFRSENIARNWATAYDFPAVQKGAVKKEEVKHRLPTGMQGFAINTRRDIFKDARVRQALAWAFDFEWMNKNLFYGSYTRTTSYFSNSELASSGLPSKEELALLEPFRASIPPEVFTQEYKLPVTDGSGNNREELRRSLELLRAAGWQVKDRKLVNAAGQQFAFTILSSDPSYERVALPYIETLRKLGMAVGARTVDPSQYQRLTDDFDFDVSMSTFGEGELPGNEQRDYWTCAAAKETGSNNMMGACQPVIDRLVEKVISAQTFEELIPAARALDRVLLWSWYVVPNWHLSILRLAYWDRFGKPGIPVRSGTVVDAWWFDPAKAAASDAAKKS